MRVKKQKNLDILPRGKNTSYLAVYWTWWGISGAEMGWIRLLLPEVLKTSIISSLGNLSDMQNLNCPLDS